MPGKWFTKKLSHLIIIFGSWDFEPVDVPTDWKTGTGIPPELTSPRSDKWKKTKIKIPSPWNVNEWGGGSRSELNFITQPL